MIGAYKYMEKMMLKKLWGLLLVSCCFSLHAMEPSIPLQENVIGAEHVIIRPLYKTEPQEDEFPELLEIPFEQARQETKSQNIADEYKDKLSRMPLQWPANEHQQETIRTIIGPKFARRYLQLTEEQKKQLFMDMFKQKFSKIKSKKIVEVTVIDRQQAIELLLDKKRVLEAGIDDVLTQEGFAKARL